MDVQEQLRQDKVRALLRAAALSNRRLQWETALQQCQEALALDRDNAEAHELVGDILQAMGNWESALQAYRTAQKLNPQRTVLEEKIGLVSIELDQMALREQRHEQLRADPTQLRWEERDPKVVCLLSALLPGWGQFYNGDTIKAAVVLTVFAVSLAIWLFAVYDALSAATAKTAISDKLGALTAEFEGWGTGKLLWVLLNCLISGGMWTYSVIEAPLRARRINRTMRAELGVE